jgi:hypothetical protein
MLVNGQFIKEALPKISWCWMPKPPMLSTPEEFFIQDVVLGVNPYATSIVEKFFRRVL